MSDGGTRLIAACWSMAGAAGILLSLRIYCKLWRGRGLWWDDHLLIASWISLAIAVSINTYIVSLGFGQHVWTISEENLKIINLNTILVATFGIIATTVSKTSFAVTLYRISTSAWMRYFLIFVIITVNVSMNLVWIFGFAKCTPRQRVWDKSIPGTCWDPKKLVKFQLFAAYYSAILDFVLALLPWQILMGRSMLRRERLGIAIAMSLGAIAGITGIVKAVLVVNMTSTDFTFQRVDLTIWTLTEPAASIMAISIPVLRMLYRELKTSRNKYYGTPSGGALSNQPGGPNSHQASAARQSKRFGPHSKYGRNSVVIMSNAGWEESQEALRDPESGRAKSSPNQSGVLKTEEVRVYSERMSTVSDGTSMELKAMGPSDRKGSGSNTS